MASLSGGQSLEILACCSNEDKILDAPSKCADYFDSLPPVKKGGVRSRKLPLKLLLKRISNVLKSTGSISMCRLRVVLLLEAAVGSALLAVPASRLEERSHACGGFEAARRSGRLRSGPCVGLGAAPQQGAVAELEVQTITSSVKGNVSVPEVFVGNDGMSRQLFDNGVVLPVGWTGASTRRRTGSQFTGGIGSTSWPVGEASANPGQILPFSRSTWLQGLRGDLRRRLPLYGSDLADGFKSPAKTAGAVLFLYFAVLAPAIAFGGVMTTVTFGALGPRDVILSCGLSGMAYALVSGQPMTFVAPTGLTLSFIGALSAWTVKAGVPFLPMYAWCGLWTSAYLAVLASFNASALIRYCTRFTEDVFNSLLAFNFLAEGATPILKLLKPALAGARGTAADALLALNSALATSLACRSLASAPRSRFFTAKFRALVADFGPALVIVGMSALLRTAPLRSLGKLARLELGDPRTKVFSLVDLGALAVPYRLLAAVPALFLATLFFLDQNITVRTVNSPQNKLRKGEAYHLDLFALALVTLGSSLLGLPWMCSATVQSLNHVRALSNYAVAEEVLVEAPDKADEKRDADKNKRPQNANKPPATSDRRGPPLPSPDEIIRAAKVRANATAVLVDAAAEPQERWGPAAAAVPAAQNGAAQTPTGEQRRLDPAKAKPAASSPWPPKPPASSMPLPPREPRNDKDIASALARSNGLAPTPTPEEAKAQTPPFFVATATVSSNRTDVSAIYGGLSESAAANGAAARTDGAAAAANANANETKVDKPGGPVPATGGGATAVAAYKQKKNATSSQKGPIAAPNAGGAAAYEVTSVVETRVSGFAVHALVLASLNFAPVLSQVPLAVVWGVFLFLGSKVVAGNQFIERSKALLLDTKRLDPSNPVERAVVELGRPKVLRFTATQAACLAALWLLKLNKATAMIFPSVIGVLLVLRATLLPRFFAPRELLTLDTEIDSI